MRQFGAPGVVTQKPVLAVHYVQTENTGVWQIGQASRAVELFQKHYHRFRQEQTGDAPEDAKPPDHSGKPTNLDMAIYTHVMRGLASTAVSPLDLLSPTG